MRASRLLSILMLLQTRGRMSAPTLAAKLEVSQRTILRDVDQLCASGVPIFSDRGREGGFQLLEGWHTNLTGLTDDEAQALFLSGMPSAAAELGLGTASASAKLKMLAALPAELRANAAQLDERLHFDPIDWYRTTTPTEFLQSMARCIWHQNTAQIEYESWRGNKNRLIQPLGLVMKAGVWYAAAIVVQERSVDAAPTEPRIYRLSNINKLTINSARFERPSGFDLASFWKASTKRFESEIYTATARLRVSQRGMKKVMALGAIIGEAAKSTAFPDPAEPSLSRIQIPIESIDDAAERLIGIGTDVEVLEPLALRVRIKTCVEAICAIYQA